MVCCLPSKLHWRLPASLARELHSLSANAQILLSLCASQKRTGYSPSCYRGRWPRPRACPTDSQSGRVSFSACIGGHSFCGQTGTPGFNCRTGAVVISDTTAFDISYAAFPAAILCAVELSTLNLL